MNIFREIPPTAGFPICLKDFFSARKPGSLEKDFQDYLQVPYAAVVYSGTAAFYFILETLKKLSRKTTVVVPSFVCPLVPLAVARAGLKVEVCDIQSDRFDYNCEELEKLCRDNKDILAVVVVHLAGIPVDLDSVSAITKKYGIFLVEDCAQALGAEYKGKRVGTFGDFAFFSLCRGKGLTIYEGGVVVASRSKHISLAHETMNSLENKNIFSEGLKILELFGYGIFYRPLLFWFVFKLPQIFWYRQGNPARAMGEYADTNFPTHKVSSFRKALGHAFFYHLDEKIAKQREKAAYYFEKIKNVQGIRPIVESPSATAVYPYLALIVDSAEKREKILKTLNAQGWGASVIYISALADYDFLAPIVPHRPCRNARYLAEHTLSLSTSAFLNNKDITGITDAVAAIND